MTVGTITTVSGLDTTVVAISLLLIGQKARNSGCNWFIQLSNSRCPITSFCCLIEGKNRVSNELIRFEKIVIS